MSNRRMLVIPGGFIPFNDTVTLLSYKHLRLLDYKMDVIALRGKQDDGLNDMFQQDPNSSKFSIEYVCDYDEAVATFEKKNVLQGLWNIFRYCRACIKKSKENDYSVIYSSSVPSFTHLAAYLIKRKKKDKVIWLASFSDPLYKSPYKYDPESFKEYSLLGKIGFLVYIFIYMNGWYERLAMKHADKIITICEQQRDFMISHYSNAQQLKEKTFIIPLNYIPEWPIYYNLIKIKKHKTNRPFVLAHIGRIYGLRKINLFLEAIKELNEEFVNFDQIFSFHQYGEILTRYQQLIKIYNLESIVKISDKIPYQDVLNKMESADCLGLFDTLLPDEQLQPYLPSKVLEYILLRKKCFILTTKKSPAYDILGRLGYVCTTNEKQAIKERILTLLNTDETYDYDLTPFTNQVAVESLQNYLQNKFE